MIQDAADLFECETVLSRQLDAVVLLSQLRLRPNDVRRLRTFIQAEIEQKGAEGVEFLTEFAPVCLACFMVWEGILHYGGGDYWSAVTQILPFPSVPEKLGRFFLNFLTRHQLPVFTQEGKHYITTILAHGGIPDTCLKDFFQHLLAPVLNDELELPSDIGTDELIDEWKENPALFHFSHQPVIRFLRYGSDVAISFLERCIAMAEAFADGDSPTAVELDLPHRIIAKYAEWQEKRDCVTSEKRAKGNRFTRPFLVLNPDEGEIQLRVPKQTLLGSVSNLSLDIIGDGVLLDRQPVETFIRNVSETEELSLILSAPAREYQIRLSHSGSLLKRWTLPGCGGQTPYLIFHEDSCKRVRHQIVSARFWLVIPEVFRICDKGCILEEGCDFYGDWFDYRAYLVDCAGKSELLLDSDSGQTLSLLVHDLKPSLIGGNRIPCIFSGQPERLPVFSRTLPELHIPVTSRHDVTRWHLSIVPFEQQRSHRQKYAVTELAEHEPASTETVIVSLHHERLLGNAPCGRFRIHVQGPLGVEQEFRLCVLPHLEVHFDKDFYLDKPASVILHTSSDVTIASHQSDSVSNITPGTIAISSLESLIHLQLNSHNGTMMPLTIRVPRLQWRLRGFPGERDERWTSRPLEIDLQNWEQYVHTADLLVDPGASLRRIWLEHTVTQHSLFPASQKRRLYRFTGLAQFSDTIRNSGKAVTRLSLNIAGKQSVEALRIQVAWEITELRCETDASVPGHYTVVFSWHDKGEVADRVIRLHHRTNPEQPEIIEDIADGAASVTITRPFQTFLPGEYRVEFMVEDEWGTFDTPVVAQSFLLPIGTEQDCAQQLSHWKIENFKYEESIENNQRRLSLTWYCSSLFQNRILRMHNRSLPQLAPIEEPVPDGGSELTIQRPFIRFLPGMYRFEITVGDAWAQSYPLPENCYFEVQVGHEHELEELLRAWAISALECRETRADGMRQLMLRWERQVELPEQPVRLHNLSCPWMEFVEEIASDGASQLTIQRPLANFLPGLYRVEFPLPELDIIPESRSFTCLVGKHEPVPLQRLRQHHYVMIISEVELEEGGRKTVASHRYGIVPEKYLQENRYSGKLFVLIRSQRKRFPVSTITFQYDAARQLITAVEGISHEKLYYHAQYGTLCWYKEPEPRQSSPLMDWNSFFTTPTKTPDKHTAPLPIIDRSLLKKPQIYHIRIEAIS